MFDLRSDIFKLGRICPVKGQICLVKLDLAQWKSKLGAKTMNLGSDKLTTCKLSTKKLKEIKGITRSNIKTRNHT
jgi:hypothetical protein